MTTKTYTYPWRATSDSFFDWLLPSMLTHMDDDAMEVVRGLSKNYTEVELDVRVNGVAVDARKFFKSFESRWDFAVERAASEMFNDIERLNELNDVVYEFTQEVKAARLKAARKAGLDVESDW